MASNALTNLRGQNPGANRQTDAISRLVEPVAKAVMATPIMGAKPPAWILPQLLNGFTAVAGYVPPRYHLNALGYVNLQVVSLNAGGCAIGTVMFNIQKGYRPSASFIVAGDMLSAFGSVRISPTGDVITRQVLAPASSLNFIVSFLAEQ